MSYRFFATAAPGIASVLAEELRSLGHAELQERPGGVAFSGDLQAGYQAALWLRTANRVLLPLLQVPAKTPEMLYQALVTFPWQDHLAPDGSFALEISATQPVITHTHYALLKAKDAIVDNLRQATGQRPSVQLTRPDVALHLHLQRDQATLSLDLAGDSLHQRGYRGPTGAAPLKETLAAALLLRAQWPKLAQRGLPLVDPMCGSGTLLIEAAWLAGDRAPGLGRPYFGFLGWQQHVPVLWERLQAQARERAQAGLARIPPLYGQDRDMALILAATANANRAGVAGHITFQTADFHQRHAPLHLAPGLVITNPPYGERIGHEVETLHHELGQVLKQHYPGWQAAVFTHAELVVALGLHPQRQHVFANGTLDCRLVRYQLWQPRSDLPTPAPTPPAQPGPSPVVAAPPVLGSDAVMFANRLRKNLHKLRRWVTAEAIHCYRAYDADMPEFSLALDLYRTEQGELWANAQEYAAPAEIDPAKAQARWQGALQAIAQVLELPPERVVARQRKRQQDGTQYSPRDQMRRQLIVQESGLRFAVNLHDYLDTGLFLDHRWVRRWLRDQAAGKRFLNLFAYTASATVYAVAGGATESLTVDMSPTYLEWASENFRLNNISPWQHKFQQADCLAWLQAQARRPQSPGYDLIFIDPPTFSRSKRMHNTFNVQTDHVALLQAARALLAPGGQLLFSTNYRQFKLDTLALAGWQWQDLTAASIPPDFARNPKIHFCYLFRPQP